MDIQTMENNIKGRIYFQYADFHDDLMRVLYYYYYEQIWNNCISYHTYKGNDSYRQVGENMKDYYCNHIVYIYHYHYYYYQYNKICELKWNYLERDDPTGDSEDESNYGGTNESSFKTKHPKHGILKRFCKCLNPNRTGMVVCHSNLTRDHCHGFVHLSCFDLTESDYNDSFICPLCREYIYIYIYL